jgi:hypothetical protein
MERHHIARAAHQVSAGELSLAGIYEILCGFVVAHIREFHGEVLAYEMLASIERSEGALLSIRLSQMAERERRAIIEILATTPRTIGRDVGQALWRAPFAELMEACACVLAHHHTQRLAA